MRAGDRDEEPKWSWISDSGDMVLGWVERHRQKQVQRKRPGGVGGGGRLINARSRNEKRRVAGEDLS